MLNAMMSNMKKYSQWQSLSYCNGANKAHWIGLVVVCFLLFVLAEHTLSCFWDCSEAAAPKDKPLMEHKDTLPPVKSDKKAAPEENHVAALGEKIKTFWGLEVMVIDRYPVTVKKIVTALIVLIAGIIGVRALRWAVRHRVLPRTHLQQTTAAVVEKVFYYFALLMVVLFALRMLNVPLAAFAFLGGALAIGLGFGAQNLVNNFISGFIVMGERPIKIGDLVEVEGNLAIVEEIGARCTRIRTGSNVHILVPNSSFLEKSIINWTLSDQRIRTSVSVGVIYGSPVREVERLLIQAANEHSKIIKDPEPFVLFTEFGDNALLFELFFWIRMTRLLERRIIESDIRFHIDELFREAGIVIAFPQRDVHLDTVAPLEVRVVDGKSGSRSNEY